MSGDSMPCLYVCMHMEWFWPFYSLCIHTRICTYIGGDGHPNPYLYRCAYINIEWRRWSSHSVDMYVCLDMYTHIFLNVYGHPHSLTHACSVQCRGRSHKCMHMEWGVQIMLHLYVKRVRVPTPWIQAFYIHIWKVCSHPILSIYTCIYARAYNNYLYTPMCLCIGTLEGSAFHSLFIHVDASNGGG